MTLFMSHVQCVFQLVALLLLYNVFLLFMVGRDWPYI